MGISSATSTCRAQLNSANTMETTIIVHTIWICCWGLQNYCAPVWDHSGPVRTGYLWLGLICGILLLFWSFLVINTLFELSKGQTMWFDWVYVGVCSSFDNFQDQFLSQVRYRAFPGTGAWQGIDWWTWGCRVSEIVGKVADTTGCCNRRRDEPELNADPGRTIVFQGPTPRSHPGHDFGWLGRPDLPFYSLRAPYRYL